MILKIIVAGIAVLCWTVPGLSQDAAPDNPGGRYIFEKQTDGQPNSYLRLDTQTGEVSLCHQKTVGWACEAAPEDRAVLESEIARLRSENIALKRDILSRGLPLPPGAMPEPPTVRNNQPRIHLPGDADIDRMVASAGRVWHRLVDALEQAWKHILNKS